MSGAGKLPSLTAICRGFKDHETPFVAAGWAEVIFPPGNESAGAAKVHRWSQITTIGVGDRCRHPFHRQVRDQVKRSEPNAWFCRRIC